MMTYYENPNNPEILISWNGSSTFHVLVECPIDGSRRPVDVFTVYGEAEEGGACSPTEAHEVAERHFAESERISDLVTDWDE